MSSLSSLCAANRTFASPCGKSGVSGQSEYFYGNALPDLELMSTFRSLVESAVVRPRQAREDHEVSIRGQLANLMGTDMSALMMVAGEGLEPPTPGL